MAGDWIKIEHTLPDKPEVIRMSSLLRIDQDAVSGKLVRLWVWADQNSVTGGGINVTFSFIDRLVSKRGFAHAMSDCGWLEGEDGDITFPGFDRHNGSTAKARGESNRRMAKSRSGKNGCGNVAEKAQQKAQPEKRREENIVESKLSTAGAASEQADFQSEINSLRQSWGRAKGFSGDERSAYNNNFELIASIPPEDWLIMKSFLAAKLPQGDPGWQPNSRLKCIQTIADVHSHALRWQSKRQPPKAQPEAIVERKTIPREELAQFLNIDNQP